MEKELERPTEGPVTDPPKDEDDVEGHRRARTRYLIMETPEPDDEAEDVEGHGFRSRRGFVKM